MTKSVPYVPQMEISDCGAACLAMALAFHGRPVALEELRRATRTGRGGVDGQALAEAARQYGLEARGVSLELDALPHLARGSILHWAFNHFVVFDRARRKGIEIVDPAQGRRLVTMEELGRSFTGVAIELRGRESVRADARVHPSAWRFLRPVIAQWPSLARIGATSVFIQAFALAVPILTGVVVDRVVPRADVSLLIAVTAGLAVMVLFHFISSLVRAHVLLRLRTILDSRLTFAFVDHLIALPYAFFLQRSSGDLMARLNSNGTVREILTSATLSTLLDGTLVGVYLLLLVAQSPAMGTLVLGLALIQVAILAASRRPNQRLLAESIQAQAKSQSYLVQMFAAIQTLKAAGAEHRATAHWSRLFVRELNASVARGRLAALVDSAIGALRIGSPLVVLAFGARQVLAGELTLGTMLALSALAAGFLTPLAALVTTGMQLQMLGGYIERINDVFEMPLEQQRAIVVPAGRLRGGITLESTCFHYAPGAPDVVREISLDIQPGQHLAIVGRSGSGKSTLAHLLLGLYTPTSGRILYDGVDLSRLEVGSVRRQVGMVLQHTYLFGASIRENIALADPAISFDAVVRAARLAHIHDDIMAMPMGYDSILADGGASLSGGQRQRIALARALVHEPVLLVLDEATSALDAMTERAVYESLASQRCTRIVIAHRIGTVSKADLILVMEDGRVVEQGTHDELLALGGRYAELAVVPERSAPVQR
jgi:ATP-binding cassette, subfamily B, bacterial